MSCSEQQRVAMPVLGQLALGPAGVTRTALRARLQLEFSSFCPPIRSLGTGYPQSHFSTQLFSARLSLDDFNDIDNNACPHCRRNSMPRRLRCSVCRDSCILVCLRVFVLLYQ
jgi:hypothetical protein